MTKPLTQIPDIAYSIEGDLIKIEQSTGCGEFTYIDLHKIHVQLFAEQMLLVKPVHIAHMSDVVNEEIKELFWMHEAHWQSVCNDRHMDLEHMVDAKNIYQKLFSLCRLIGLDPESLSNLEDANEKPIYPPPSIPKVNAITPKPKANAESNQGSLV
jgi:flagellar biosynthesis regulator FlbT